MALVPEDGTGLANANSYASVADADAYFSDRANAAWAALQTAAKEASLISATSYIDVKNYGLFKGRPEFPDTPQALAFPRTCMVGLPDGVPLCVKQATYEYALRNATNTAGLTPDPTIDATGRLYTKSLEKVGPLTEEFDYATVGPLASPMTWRPYPYADALLRPVLQTTGRVIRN